MAHNDLPSWLTRTLSAHPNDRPVDADAAIGADSHNQPFLTIADTAKALRVSVKTVRRMLADGRLGGIKIGRLVRIRVTDLDRLA